MDLIVLGTFSVTRREVVGGLAATASALTSAPGFWAPLERSLKEHAQDRGLIYGTMVQRQYLASDLSYKEAILLDAAMVAPGDEMKWGLIEVKPTRRDYSDADFISQFAKQNNLKLRAQPAVWAQNVPSWLETALLSPSGRDIFQNHIRNIVSRFSGQAYEWDVVNEAIEPTDGLQSGLRNSIFHRAFGADYIARSFQIARDTDPRARLFYNDYGIEYASPGDDARRRAIINLLTRLKRDNIPIDGLGIQAHLKVGNRFNPAVFRRFLSEVAALDMRIMLTEFDINDERLGPSVNERDIAVAAHAREFLDVTFDEPAVAGIITWGISDRYTWLNSKSRARRDGIANRALPLDDQLHRKPLWHAIAKSLDDAPVRK